MEKKNGIQWTDLLLNKAFDLVMLIIGVSIAFQVDNWKIDADHRALERFYKERLLADVKADIAEINEIMAELHSDRKILEDYLPVMDNLPADSLLSPLLAIISLETFTANGNTYETVVASTGMNTFSDRELIEYVTEYYSSYTSIRRFESVYTTLLMALNNHFVEHLIYDQKLITNKSVVAMPATRNFLVLADSQLNTGIEEYQAALSLATALKEALEKSL